MNSPRRASTSESPSGTDLRVSIGTVDLKNPIIAASGTFAYGIEFAELVDLSRLGGLVVKGLSLEPMAGAPAPRMHETAAGMINAIGLQNIGVRAFVSEKLPQLQQYQTKIIANVFGRTIREYVEVIRVLEGAEGLAAYELNISCPNVERGGAEYGTDPALVAEVVGAARAAASRPLWVKLSPSIGNIGLTAKSAESAGADAVVVANTYPAMSINAHTRRSHLGSTTGGLSGAAIKPITMKLVYDAYRVINIPILGLGGIDQPADVIEYMVAGAAAVEVGTANFADPRVCGRLAGTLEKWCAKEKILRIRDLRGSLEE